MKINSNKPVLFLDVDGVLNKHKESGKDSGLDIKKCELIKQLIEQVEDLQIILSSAWRYMGYGKDSVFQQCLRGIGIDDWPIIGMTELENTIENRDVTIWKFVFKNKLKNWAVLDDLECISKLGRRAVQTDSKKGVSKKDIRKIANILNRKNVY